MLLEQFGGANGELAAAMQYSIQGLNMSALESMGKDPLEIGRIPPTPGVVDHYYNDSTGENGEGDEDFTGPWNKSNGMVMVQGPAQPIAEATAAEVRKELKQAAGKGASAQRSRPKKPGSKK